MTSPWMNTAEVAERLRYTGKCPLRSVYRFIERTGVVPHYDGSRLLLARVDVDAAIARGRRVSPVSLANLRPQARLHAKQSVVSAQPDHFNSLETERA